MRCSKTIAILLVTPLLAGCTEPNGEPGYGIENGGALSRQDVGIAVGTIGGGVIGGAIGAGAGRTAAVIGGVLLGGILGSVVGKSLDDTDRAIFSRASQTAMESGQPQSWNNPDSGYHGRIVPNKSYTNSKGKTCRRYSQTIYLNGKHQGYGTACRMPSGVWRNQ